MRFPRFCRGVRRGKRKKSERLNFFDFSLARIRLEAHDAIIPDRQPLRVHHAGQGGSEASAEEKRKVNVGKSPQFSSEEKALWLIQILSRRIGFRATRTSQRGEVEREQWERLAYPGAVLEAAAEEEAAVRVPPVRVPPALTVPPPAHLSIQTRPTQTTRFRERTMWNTSTIASDKRLN